MIEIYKIAKGVQQINKPEKGSWIRYTQPTEQELEQLKKTIPEDFLTSVQDSDEIPFIEKHGKQLLVLIRIPIKTGEKEIPYKTIPMGLILTKDQFITICNHENELIPRFKTYKTEYKGMQPLLRMMYASARTYLAYLKEINKEIYTTEQDLEKTTKNKDLLELFELEKSLVYFSTAISSNRVIIERIEKLIPETDQELHDDLTQEYKQASYMTKIYSIVVNSTLDTYSSIISNNLNKVIKALTIITIILMLPTLVASIYGMNIELPLQHSPHAFPLIILGSLALTLAGIILLRKKALL